MPADKARAARDEGFGLTGIVVRGDGEPPCVALKSVWLPGQDSNLGQRIQSPLCYRCTTGQGWRAASVQYRWERLWRMWIK